MGLYTGPEIGNTSYLARFIRLADFVFVSKPKENISALELAEQEEISHLIKPYMENSPLDLDAGIMIVNLKDNGLLDIALIGSAPNSKIPVQGYESQVRQRTINLVELSTPTPLLAKVRGSIEAVNLNDPNAKRKRRKGF